MIDQISIFTENRKGAMHAVTRLLAEAGVSILSFVTNDSAEFGIVRMLVSDPKKAEHILRDAQYMTKKTSVLAVEIENVPGSLDRLLQVIEEANLNINYLYTAYNSKSGKPVIALHAEEIGELEFLLQSRGFCCR